MKFLKPEGELEVDHLQNDGEKSIALVKIRGVNRPTINHGQTGKYLCLGGFGEMNIAGLTVELERGVVVVIPPEVAFQDRSIGEEPLLLEANYFPPFDPKKVTVLDVR